MYNKSLQVAQILGFIMTIDKRLYRKTTNKISQFSFFLYLCSAFSNGLIAQSVRASDS